MAEIQIRIWNLPNTKSAEVLSFIATIFNSYRSQINIYDMNHAALECRLQAAELQHHSP
jgi:hypothetical protein